MLAVCEGQPGSKHERFYPAKLNQDLPLGGQSVIVKGLN